MAHELTIREDGKVEMAFHGDKPWHFGETRPTEMQANATIPEWIVGAGMEWSVDSSRVVYRARGSNKVCVIDDSVVLHRSDDDAALGIVSSSYQVVQPQESFEFFRDLIHSLGFQINTAGTMFGGKRWFVSALIGEQALIKNDNVRAHLLFTSSADGTLKTRAKFVSERVVCNNTLSIALGEKNKGGEVAISHRSVFDADAAKAALGLVPATFDSFMDSMRKLTTRRLSGDIAETMTQKLVGKDQKANKNIMALFGGDAKGFAEEGFRGTAWGWLNSVTEYVDHGMRAKSDSHRLNNNLFGTGDTLKNAAREMALDYAN
jgi:phage/plasmid-like protein (TIGR03299 family)